MNRIMLVICPLIGLISCRTIRSSENELEATRSWAKRPSFAVDEWKNHPGGPRQDSFFLQNQLYEVSVTVGSVPKTPEKQAAVLTIRDASGQTLTTSNITIKARGFTSIDFAKKQYGINLVDEAGKDKKLPLLDMPAAESWVLSAPYNDKSLLRDILTYNVSNKIGRHAPRTRIVSLTMKVGGQEAERMGIYVLTEKNDIGPGRIDVPKKTGSDTAFLATFDHRHDGDNVAWSGRDTDVILEYPSVKNITPAQQAEFLSAFEDVDQRVTNASGPSWTNIFDERLDLDSAVDFFIVQEFARNIDGYRLSSSFYMPPKGKIFFGPVWDFNIAYGNAAHERGAQYTGWRAREKGVWFGTLMTHPLFCAALKDRWTKLRNDGSLSNDTVYTVIDQHAAIMEPISTENFRKWPSLGRYLWPNPYWLATWDEEKGALKSWVSLRLQWMDKEVQTWDCSELRPSPAQESSR